MKTKKCIFLSLTMLLMTGSFALADTPASEDYLCFSVESAYSYLLDTMQLSLTKIGNPNLVQLEYSRDKVTWSDYAVDSLLLFTVPSDVAYFRAKTTNGSFFTTNNDYYRFAFDNYEHPGAGCQVVFHASGNIMSLLDKTCSSNIVPAKGFAKLFSYPNDGGYSFSGTLLKTAPSMPATELGDSCYYWMSLLSH